jgi:uncharacterized protein YdaU (DUF1376 family)
MKGEFYKMDYEAWDEGTDGLSLEQEAAYLRLCHQLYRRKASIPNAPATLARIWRCHPNKARKLLADLVAAGKVVEKDGHLTNTRVTRELDDRETRRTQKADAGHTGGTRTQDNRRKSLKTLSPDQASVVPPDKQNQAEKEGEGEKEDTPKVPKGTDTGFDRFRAAYPPKHVSFPTTQARKRYDQAIKAGATPDEIEAGAKAYAAEQLRIGKSGTEFVKSADSWLFQRRWLDYAKPTGEPQSAPTPKLNPEQDRRHRLRLAIDHFRDEWRQGTDEQYRPGTSGCTTAPEILEEARLAVATERILTERPPATNAA